MKYSLQSMKKSYSREGRVNAISLLYHYPCFLPVEINHFYYVTFIIHANSLKMSAESLRSLYS